MDKLSKIFFPNDCTTSSRQNQRQKKSVIIYLSIGISEFCSSIIAERKRERNFNKRKNGVL